LAVDRGLLQVDMRVAVRWCDVLQMHVPAPFDGALFEDIEVVSLDHGLFHVKQVVDQRIQVSPSNPPDRHVPQLRIGKGVTRDTVDYAMEILEPIQVHFERQPLDRSTHFLNI